LVLCGVTGVSDTGQFPNMGKSRAENHGFRSD
jgi:hypothetical protein